MLKCFLQTPHSSSMSPKRNSNAGVLEMFKEFMPLQRKQQMLDSFRNELVADTRSLGRTAVPEHNGNKKGVSLRVGLGMAQAGDERYTLRWAPMLWKLAPLKSSNKSISCATAKILIARTFSTYEKSTLTLTLTLTFSLAALSLSRPPNE